MFKCLMKELEKKAQALEPAYLSVLRKNFDVLFNNFYINAFGQVGEGA